MRLRQDNLLLQNVWRYGTYKSFPVVSIFQILLYLLTFLFGVYWVNGQYWLTVISTVKTFQIIMYFYIGFDKVLKPIQWLAIRIYCTLFYRGWGCVNYWEVNYLRNIVTSKTANPSLIFCDTFLIVVCPKLGH